MSDDDTPVVIIPCVLDYMTALILYSTCPSIPPTHVCAIGLMHYYDSNN